MSESDEGGPNVQIDGDLLGNMNIAGRDINITYIQRPMLDVPYLAPPMPDKHISRSAELAELRSLVLGESKDAFVTALRGMGGLGKTTLAIALCHEEYVIEAFTDGILWATLGPNADVISAQQAWAEALGWGDEMRSVADPANRAALLRGWLSGKRILLVIDDVWSAADLEAMQVGGEHCVTLITTRERSVARRAQSVRELGLLDPQQSIDLLAEWAGEIEEGVRSKAGELARRLGYLPLALALAGAQIDEGDDWDDLLGIFRDEQGADITLLDFSDPSVRDESLALTFKLSLERLSGVLPHQFALLGVFESGHEAPFDAAAAAAVWQITEARAKRALRDLSRAALVDRENDLYALHSLVKDYGLSLLDIETRTHAEHLHSSHYLSIATQKTSDWQEIDTAWPQIRLAVERPSENKLESQYNWLMALCGFLGRRGYWYDLIRLAQNTLKLAKDTNEFTIIGRAMFELGRAAQSTGDMEEALKHYTNALNTLKNNRDFALEAAIYGQIGHIYRVFGQLDDAFQRFEEAMAFYRELGDRIGEAKTFNDIGRVHDTQGQLSKAVECYQQALNTLGEIHAPSLKASVFNNLGSTSRAMGKLNDALEYFQRSLQISDAMGDRSGEAAALSNIGNIYDSYGQREKALTHYQQALNIMESINDRMNQSAVLNNIATILWLQGQLIEARDYFEKALEARYEMGHKGGIAKTSRKLAIIHKQLGNLEEALKYIEITVEIDKQMGLPESQDDSELLAEIRRML